MSSVPTVDGPRSTAFDRTGILTGMRLVSKSWHVLAQLAGLVMLAVAVGLEAGFVWGLGAGGAGILVVGVAAERGQRAREATLAG